VLLALLLVFLGGASPSSAATSTSESSAGLSYFVSSSPNYAGYVQSGTNLNSVSAQWTVPNEPKAVSGQTTGVSTWIGIGGVHAVGAKVTSAPLVQEGVSWTSVKGGAPVLKAFYEFVNAKDTCCLDITMPLRPTGTGPVVAAGDHVAGILSSLSNTEYQFVFDVSKGTSLVSQWNEILTLPFAVPGQSAEAILERGKINNVQVGLAQTSPVTFTKAFVCCGTAGGSSPLGANAAGLTLYREFITNPTPKPTLSGPQTVAYPGVPTDDGFQFVVTDGRAP